MAEHKVGPANKDGANVSAVKNLEDAVYIHAGGV
jgi:hypothetical protein